MHWYSRDGKPCHTQPTKKGAKNKTRPTTIKDAREQGLFPSVSGITHMLANPGLDRYKAQQIVKACYECTPVGGESIECYQAHILDKAGQEAGKAADLGTLIHAAIESHLTGAFYNPEELVPLADGTCAQVGLFVDAAVEKMNELGIVVLEAEGVLVNHAYGYAGTTDVKGEVGGHRIIADFKSTKTKPGKPVEPYETHQMQIAAYHKAAFPDAERMAGFNIYISTTEIGRVEAKAWTHEELSEGWAMFKHCLGLWKLVNKYDPAAANTQGQPPLAYYLNEP